MNISSIEFEILKEFIDVLLIKVIFRKCINKSASTGDLIGTFVNKLKECDH